MQFEIRVLAVALAVALQIQATLPVGAGLRVAVSDLLLPVATLYAGAWIAVRPSRLRWRMPGVALWLVAITAALTVALFVGGYTLGQWPAWALVNKFGGWFALVAYFMIGTIITRAGGLDLRDEFLRVFLLAAAAVACVNVIAFPWLLEFYELPFGVQYNRMTGALANSNAFGFLLVVAMLLVIAGAGRVSVYLVTPLLAALWFTSSRGALLALVIGLVSYLVLSPRRLLPVLRPAALALVAIAAVTALSVMVDPARIAEATSGQAPLGFLSVERLDIDADTIAQREAQNARAVSMFLDAPLFGHGLGYFVETTGATLHNSLLWLLLETGLLGAVAFTGFLVTALYHMHQGREDTFLLGMVAVSIAFMAMSVSGEFLYQRHLWLLLGMALAHHLADKPIRPPGAAVADRISEHAKRGGG